MVDSRYTVTVYIASKGAPTIDENGTIGTSSEGHMWFSLDDNKTGLVQPYGFHPSKDMRPLTFIGKVKTNDNYTYMVSSQPVYRKSFPITKSEYEKLLSISENAKNNNTFGPYVATSNSCVDFTWEILSHVGIGKFLLFNDGTLKVNPEREGHIRPADNQYLVDASWNFHMEYVVPNQSDKFVEDFVFRRQGLLYSQASGNEGKAAINNGKETVQTDSNQGPIATNLFYRMQASDTLSDIAAKRGMGMEDLLKANPQISYIQVNDVIYTPSEEVRAHPSWADGLGALWLYAQRLQAAMDAINQTPLLANEANPLPRILVNIDGRVYEGEVSY